MTKDGFERTLTIPKDAKAGETTIRVAHFQKQHAWQVSYLSYYYASVTVGDATSAVYKDATYAGSSKLGM